MQDDNLYPISTEYLLEAPAEQQTATEVEKNAVQVDHPIMLQAIDYLSLQIDHFNSISAIAPEDRKDTQKFMVTVDANARLVSELNTVKGWLEALIAEHIK